MPQYRVAPHRRPRLINQCCRQCSKGNTARVSQGKIRREHEVSQTTTSVSSFPSCTFVTFVVKVFAAALVAIPKSSGTTLKQARTIRPPKQSSPANATIDEKSAFL